MRKAGIALGILAILVVAVLYAAPRLVDLAYLKRQIVTQVQARTGRNLVIAGPLQFALLPVPSLRAEDLRLANPPGAATPTMLRLRALDVKLAFWPLLAGRFEIRSATLVGPELDVETLPNGAANLRLHLGPGAPVAPLRITPRFTIHELAIEDGTILLHAAHGVERAERIDGRLSLDSLGGPFRAQGTLRLRGVALSFDASAGPVAGDRLPLYVSLAAGAAGRLDFEGTASGTLEAPVVTGKLKLQSADAAQLAATLSGQPGPALLARSLEGNATLNASLGGLSLQQVALELGDARATGRLALKWGAPPRFDLALLLDHIDLDTWLAGGRKSATGGTAPPAVPDTAAASLPTALAALSTGLPWLRRYDGTISVSVDAVLWRGAIIRQARLLGQLTQGRFVVSQLGALFPGSTTVQAAGNLTLAAAKPRFAGHLTLESDDLRELFSWVGMSAGAVPADRLRRAVLSSEFVLVGDRLDLQGIDMSIDATRVTGAAAIALRHRLGLGLRLAADRFNLDAYLPVARAAAGLDLGSGGAVTPLASAKGSSVFGEVDANIVASIGELTWHGQPWRQVKLDGTLQQGSLSIRNLQVGDIAGASGALSGLVDGLSTGKIVGQLAFDGRGPALERVLRLIGPDAVAGQSFGAFTMDGAIQASVGAATIDGDLKVLGGHLHLAGDLKPGPSGVNLGIELDHLSFAALMRDLSPAYGIAPDAGAVKLSARLIGGGDHYTIEDLSLAIGPSTLTGRLGLGLAGPRPMITGTLALGDWSLDRLLPLRQATLSPGVVLAAAGPGTTAPAAGWSAAPFDLAALHRIDAKLSVGAGSLAYSGLRLVKPQATVGLTDGALAVTGLSGTLFGGALSGSVTIDAATVPRLAVTGSLRGAAIAPLLEAIAGKAGAAGQVDLETSLSGTGDSPLDLISHLAGKGRLAARDGTIAGLDLAALEARVKAPNPLGTLAAATAGGPLHFSSLSGGFTFADGVARSSDVTLKAAAGTGEGSAAFDLPGWTATSRLDFRFHGLPAAPPAVLRLAGRLDAPRLEIETTALAQYLEQRSYKPGKSVAAPSSPRR